ncbi:MAG: gamma-glutamyltranspeptidase/glutathione hydrolase [Lentisphaeria bacterium]|jgi:gamma-glutamyltranspeptidase/glutathione hydrolase
MPSIKPVPRLFRGIIFAFFVYATGSFAEQRNDPEKATGFENKQLATGTKHMVVAANPLAAQLGYDILQKGGTAIDAAIAVQMGLNLVEPQSSGIGGGGFILYWDAKSKKLFTYDARETAPALATPDLFIENGKTLAWSDAIVGGKSVGVPGILKGLDMAHQQHGKLPWKVLFNGAIQLAHKGFAVSPRFAKLVAYRFHPGLLKIEPAKSYFYPKGEAISEGTWLKNKALAESFRRIAAHGADYFYTGKLAQDIVHTVNNSPIRPGTLSLSDMKQYSAKMRDPICMDYSHYELCSMDQPSSGGLALLQIFELLSHFNISELGPESADAIHLFTQASRLAYADRDRYSADADFVNIPVKALLQKPYLAARAKQIDITKDMGHAEAGTPDKKVTYADDSSYELPSTSHMSIVDQYGNALAMTTSIEMAYGSSLMVGGFLLNNQLTDFSLSPKIDGKWVANRVEPGKRPRSSMTPVMVLNKSDRTLKALLGSPGGSRIINYVAKTLIGLLDWNLSMQEAIDYPNITNLNDVTTLEKGRVPEALAKALQAKGHEVKIKDLNSGVHGIVINKGIRSGGADSRREGVVLAE